MGKQKMAQHKQPSLFVSHGTMYEALHSHRLKADFLQLRQQYLNNSPSAIVLFSGHWQTDTIAVTTSEIMVQMDEGFPPPFQTNYRTVGHPSLASLILERLTQNGIPSKADSRRGLDHGAWIPLVLLFPDERIPVIQISQHNHLQPRYHQRIAETLNPLRRENILFIASGGLVHNRNIIQKWGGHEIEPDPWVKEFDDWITNELADHSNTHYASKMISAYNHPLFKRAHPTAEHFLPLVFASAFGGQPTKIYEAYQWKNLSMSAFMFA